MAATPRLERSMWKLLLRPRWSTPAIATLLFVIGVLLQLEGESDRAKLFFQRARDPDPEPELVLD